MPSTPVLAPEVPVAPAAREPLSRLPGRGPAFRFGLVTSAPRSSLWLGVNYVLQVNSGPMRDEYRRFYYRDVQALQLRRTRGGLIFNLVCAGGLAFFGLIFALVGVAGWQAVAAVMAGLLVVLLLVNAVRGPTVRATLRTAIGLYPLPSLNRLGPAQRAFASIRERVEAVQGTLTEDALAARLDRAMRERQQGMVQQNIGVTVPSAPASFAPPPEV